MDTVPDTLSATTCYDILVVGAGPAGLAATLVLGRQNRNVLLVDSGQPRNARVHHMHMYLSRNGADPADLRRLARQEIDAHPNVDVLDGTVDSIVRVERKRPTDSADEAADVRGQFRALVGGRTVTARTVLLATGVRDVLGDLPGLSDGWGTCIHHCAYCHGYESTGQAVVVLATHPTDIMLARYLRDRFSDDVTLVTSGITAGASADTDAPTLASDSVNDARSAAIHVTDRTVRAVTESSGEGSSTVEFTDGTALTAGAVFHRPPVEQSSPLPGALGCVFSDDGLISVSATMRTSVPGVYAAGDAALVQGFPAPMQFVTSAAADGQRAAVWIEQELFTS